MTPEELKALLENAVAQVKKVEDNNTELATKIKSLNTQIDTLTEGANVPDDVKSQIEDLVNEVSDLRTKMRNPVAEITNEKQKSLLRDMALNSYNTFIKSARKTNKVDFNIFIADAADQFKALNISSPETGGRAVAEILSMDLIEYAREYSPILSQIGVRNGLTRDYRELVLSKYPAIADGIENVAGTDFAKTDTQEYLEVKADTVKVMANAPITDEAFYGTDYNVYSDLIRLLGDQLGVTLAAKVLFGNGGDKNGRGMLSSSRIDITDVTGESFKPSMGADARSSDVFPVIPTGVSGALGTDDEAIQDLMIDAHNTLPTKYLAGASYTMNRKTKGVLEKVRDLDGKPVFKFNMVEGDGIKLNGYPVNLDDTYPDIAVDSTPIVFGDLSRAFAMANGEIDYMQLNPFKKQGVTYVEYNKEIFTIMQNSDAIIVIACTANAGA